MSVLRNNTHPLVVTDDRVLIAFSHYELKAKVYIKALTPNCQAVIRSGVDQATAQAKVAADASTPVMVLGQVEILDLPGTAAPLDRVTELRVVQGQAAIEIVSPSEFHSFFSQPSQTII